MARTDPAGRPIINDVGEVVMALRALNGALIKAPNEDALQAQVEAILSSPPHELEVRRELRLGPGERVDVAVVVGDPLLPEPEIVAVECKLDASATPVYRQIQRYANHPRVRACALVTTSRRLSLGIGANIAGGKPLYVVHVRRF